MDEVGSLVDLNDDGTEEYFIRSHSDHIEYAGGTSIYPGTSGVQIYDGATDSLLGVITPGARDAFFASTVVSIADLDLDSIADIAVGTLHIEADGTCSSRLIVYSGLSLEPLWVIRPLIAPDRSLTGFDVRSVADVNADGSVDALDIQVVINAVASQNPLPGEAGAADVNLDGSVNALDPMFYAGSPSPHPQTPSVAEFTQLLLDIEGDPVDALARNSGLTTTQVGIFKCLICAFKCGGSPIDAAQCVNDAGDRIRECIEDANGDYDAVADCYAQRPQFILDCLDDIAAAVPDCAECVRDCGPTP